MYTLITGASAGIGYELARTAATAGKDLILVARSRGKLESIKSELTALAPIRVEIVEMDLSTADSSRRLFEVCRDKNWQVENLVNNAGFGCFGKFNELPLEKQTEMVQLNITTLMELCHLFLPQMLQQKKGHILNVASTAAFVPGPLMAVYYATKAFVLHFSEAISTELEGTGVSVTALCPGPTESQFQETAGLQNSRLFNSMKIPTSASVAEFGWQAMLGKKVVAVHGASNKFLAISSGMMPRRLLRKVVLAMQSNRH